MREHPRLFNDAMVRALLAGTKTQTRRIVTAHNTLVDGHGIGAKRWQGMGLNLDHAWIDPGPSPAGEPGPYLKAPAADGTVHRIYSRIRPGDRIWVKETTLRVEEHGFIGPVYAESEHGHDALTWGLRPGPDDPAEVEPEEVRRRPSIHMPRRACRILLDVVSVRVERLQDISEMDARREGIHIEDHDWRVSEFYVPNVAYRSSPSAGVRYSSPLQAFEELWESINGPDSWDANPMVWAYEFRRVEQGGAA